MSTNIIPIKKDMEQQLQEQGLSTVESAKALTVTSDEDYQIAAGFLLGIKARAADVTAYWKEPKATAAAAHKQICAKEKAMMAPLNQAETIVKGTMLTYTRKVEEARRKAEAEARKRQQEEAERLLREAAEAEQSGDAVSAETVLTMAQMVEEMAAPVISTSAPSAAGISTRKVWKARIVNESAVPISIAGMMLRPVDETLLNKLAINSKGTMSIPGVEMYQEESIAARR